MKPHPPFDLSLKLQISHFGVETVRDFCIDLGVTLGREPQLLHLPGCLNHTHAPHGSGDVSSLFGLEQVVKAHVIAIRECIGFEQEVFGP